MINNKKKSLTGIFAVFVFAVSAVATFIIFKQTTSQNTETASVDSTAKTTAAPPVVTGGDQPYGLPKRLVIPKINVNADILYMGLDASGNMESPKTNHDSGWYKYGPSPGNKGSAVIAGHLGVGSPAVFTELDQLVKGDTVSVTDDRGEVVSFVVTETRQYDYDTEPAEVFTSSSGAHLNLITCNGDWDSELNTYAKRLVVFTDRV